MIENENIYDQTSGICDSKSAIDTDSKNDSESLRTIRELNTVFANRLKDCEEAEKVSEEKLIILQQWVDSLTEQNVMLIEVVETFEKEAVHQLKVGFESQKLQNKELQVLQQQMTCKNRIIEAQHKALEKLNFPIRRSEEYDHTNNNHTKYSVNGDISKHKEESGTANSMDTRDSNEAYQACSLELESTKKQLQNAEIENEVLRKNVDEVEKKIEKINQMMISNEKNAREMRAALTAEVAEKHDQVLALRRDAQLLEERLRQADMQTHFKDDIIKELRKEIKIASNKLIGQLRDKDVAVNNLEEKLKIFKELPVEVSAQLYHLKQRVSSLNELLAAAAKHRNEPKNDVQLVLNSILFNLNEALLLVDGYRCDGGVSTLKPDDRQHKSSSNISDQSPNQMPLTNLMNELQSFKKFLEDDKLGCKKIDDEIRTIISSVCNGNSRPENATTENALHGRFSSLQSHLKKYQDSKEKVYHKLCCLQNDQKEKVTMQPTESTCNVRQSRETNQSGSENLQCDRTRDATIRKLTNDLQELNFQLKSREQIISNQQETIDLLQNSLQMEQAEMESLKVEKDKADAHTHALQAKVLMLEAELKVVQDALSNNGSIDTSSLSGAKTLNSTASKTWAPWSGKQALPTHRHIHDV